MKAVIVILALIGLIGFLARPSHAQVSCNTFGNPNGWTGNCSDGTSWQTFTTPGGSVTNIQPPPRDPVPLPRNTGPLSQPGVAGQRGTR